MSIQHWPSPPLHFIDLSLTLRERVNESGVSVYSTSVPLLCILWTRYINSHERMNESGVSVQHKPSPPLHFMDLSLILHESVNESGMSEQH